jgi:hypothetical protein
MERIGNYRRGWEDLPTATSGQIPPVLYFSPSSIQDNEESTVGGMTTDTRELFYAGRNSSRMNLEAIMRGQKYDDETGNRPQASLSGDMIPSRPMFPSEQPPKLGISGAGSGADATKSSTGVTADSFSTTTTGWISLRDKVLVRAVIFLALVVPIGLFGYLATSEVIGGGGDGGGLRADPTAAPSSQWGTCGDGNVGNGICLDTTLCCSKFGWCGTTTEYCADRETTSSPTSAPNYSRAGGTQAPISVTPSFGVRALSPTPAVSSNFSFGGTLALTSTPTSFGGVGTSPHTPALFSIEGGTCGSGNPGDGICPDTTACCSYFGWCGFGPEYCGYRNLHARDNTSGTSTDGSTSILY